MGDRFTYLGPHALRRLDLWVTAVRGTFNQPCYLVGSSLERQDYRDVDVRMPLPDDDPFVLGKMHRLPLVNLALSMWAEHDTGLPVDFQLQPQTEFDSMDGRREPLGARWGQWYIEPRTTPEEPTEDDAHRSPSLDETHSDGLASDEGDVDG